MITKLKDQHFLRNRHSYSFLTNHTLIELNRALIILKHILFETVQGDPSKENWFEIVQGDTTMPATKAFLCNKQITQWLTNVRRRGGMTSLINNSALSLRKFGCCESTCSYRLFCSALTPSLYRSKYPPDVCNIKITLLHFNWKYKLTELHD
jgi:hypothetical protein